MPSPTAGPADLHLWQIAAARDLIIFFGVAFSLWVVYRLGDIFLPVFLALILAHIINPFVTLMEQRWRWPRPLTISLILVGFALSLLGLFAWLGPVLYEQSTMLVNRLPDYLGALAAAYGIESEMSSINSTRPFADFKSIPNKWSASCSERPAGQLES